MNFQAETEGGTDACTRLILKTPLSIPLRAPCLTPDVLAGKSEQDIARLTVMSGEDRIPLGELFHIRPGQTDGVELVGDMALVHGIGQSMRHGRLMIRGNVGRDLGAFMRGGSIFVDGSADAYAGAQMRGGRIRITGNAGRRAGGLYPGRTKGVNRGTLVIDGNAGPELGAGMRRGLVVVRGDADGFAGARMIGGTLFVFGHPGVRTGIGNRRGTIVILGDCSELPVSYGVSCTYSPSFLNCFYTQFREWGWDLPEGVESGLYRQYVGDTNVNGKGEILVFNKSE
ncbi:formylmethanofuran dehydrogenase subunit C [Pseudodesulfovibrio sp. JC047]|uniref:formylmethanofuran dehydrogenase subunit C n=1 Tax=Pseudodesulfovibrio sp. JC047 TaxID=2683199 RepID=UPI0013D58369|nr:formylmethanofuran dehydrogenase subunit C [Pseudodesulfovibrio sp. JC047]NDV19448.1 formylmethanofuran dehydrogenase subunit C [Pseudodesulfovibrio sp. JC047]